MNCNHKECLYGLCSGYINLRYSLSIWFVILYRGQMKWNTNEIQGAMKLCGNPPPQHILLSSVHQTALIHLPFGFSPVGVFADSQNSSCSYVLLKRSICTWRFWILKHNDVHWRIYFEDCWLDGDLPIIMQLLAIEYVWLKSGVSIL